MTTGYWRAFGEKKLKKIIFLFFITIVFISCNKKDLEKESWDEFNKTIEKIQTKKLEQKENHNYNNGNGTIITSFEEYGVKTTIRKCIINNIKIGDLIEEKYRTIYENYTFKNSIGKLKDNDIINVLEVYTMENLNKPKDSSGNSSGELWYRIQLENLVGCICVSPASLGEYTDPYYDNRYEILGEIQTSKKWTVRKLKQGISVWEKLNVRDTPGLDGKKVFLLHNFEEGTRSPQENHNIVAITEETETIDGRTDHWLKIEYEPGKFGWIFGGYASVERGGPKYYIPENIIIFDLSWY